jgi:hypothetical protein
MWSRVETKGIRPSWKPNKTMELKDMPNWLKNLKLDYNVELKPPPTTTEPKFERVPDGPHTFLITSAKLDDEKPMVSARLKVETFKNRELTKTFYFGQRFDIPFAELAAIGITMKSDADIENLPNTLPGRRVLGRIVTPAGEKYSKIYLNKLVDVVDVPAEKDEFEFPPLDTEEEL